jgi:predicted Zn-dependent protease
MLSPDDIKNAYADGKNIVVQKGMMDFFKSDEEVALVVSHELAHNSMKHIDAKKKNAMIGGIFGLLLDVAAAAGGVNTNGDFTRMASNAGGGAYSVEFEQEADYVGLYFMSIAGYKIDDAPNFWRRMATNNSASITMKSSHPTAPERFLALETTVKEIKGKIDNKQPLKPEMKNK